MLDVTCKSKNLIYFIECKNALSVILLCQYTTIHWEQKRASSFSMNALENIVAKHYRRSYLITGSNHLKLSQHSACQKSLELFHSDSPLCTL